MKDRPVTSAATNGTEWVPLECGFCGAKGGQYLGHYDTVRCRCGKMFWALRPHRDEPLRLFVHPGIRVGSTVIHP